MMTRFGEVRAAAGDFGWLDCRKRAQAEEKRHDRKEPLNHNAAFLA